MAPFSLARATTSDMPELAALMYRCFRPWTTSRMMGCFSEEDLPQFVDKYIRIMQEDLTDIWIKVVDNETGKIAAASNWKLYLGSEKAQKRILLEPPEWLESEDLKARSRELMDPLNEVKTKANPDPFLHLNICFTADEFRRRGAGAMMMQWANDLADSLSIPCWVEASEVGVGLYAAFGYYDVSTIHFRGEEKYTAKAMRRDARTKPIEGGRAALS